MNMHTRRAIVLIGAEVAMAASIGIAGMVGLSGKAEALPSCTYEDGSTGTDCLWSVEHDGIVSLLPACAYEDGNEDGLPCLWRDSDTGRMYYVTSEDYR